MASLRDTVKDYQDELRDGIAWVAFWKQGRSWNAEYFHLDMDDTLYPEDMSLDELTAGVRYHYENSMNDIDGFIGAHDDRLPPFLSPLRISRAALMATTTWRTSALLSTRA